MGYYVVPFFYSLLFPMLSTFVALENIINSTKSLKDGETLVSSNQMFELGFFSPGNSPFRYLGIWYKIHPSGAVWVANRENPLVNTLGSLHVTARGQLVLVNSTNNTIWSSNHSRIAKKPFVQLLDSGNLVIRDRKQKKFLWESFDNPSGTLLPGMKIGGNFNRMLSCWKNDNDPAPGNFSLQIDYNGYPQVVLKKENKTSFRLGSWFTGMPSVKDGYFIQFVLNFSNKSDYYFKYEVQNTSVASMYSLSPYGSLQLLVWSERINDWMIYSTSPHDQCDNYGICGAFASCDNYDSPACSCLDGFEPQSPRDWKFQEWLDGCKQKISLNCDDQDGFFKISGYKLPDTNSSNFYKSMSSDECRSSCLKNCSCTAYSNLNINGSGCLHWFGDLIDIKRFADHKEELYVRVASSQIVKIGKKRQMSKEMEVVWIIMFIISIQIILCLLSRNLHRCGMANKSRSKVDNQEMKKENVELRIYQFKTISDATDKFSNSNKLGQGGFGPVYKGTLKDGQEIAVKRLSKRSGQGLNEFKNEVLLIAKLQHRNLVKLLGYCIHEDEKMLIYEYMRNNSLDSVIFDQTKRKSLNWQKRKDIIVGIAQGLVYLHRDSRVRIIHRDLKTSNILLDDNNNPKISDFGLARTLRGDKTEDNTSKIVGTYGYMSPEYCANGRFSMKSDIFSFGVMILEIISGKKNREFCHPDPDRNLLSHAWMEWEKGASLDLIDECIKDSCDESEVLRCINVALLCVQQRPEKRPDMPFVVVMLSSDTPLPQALQPGFFVERTSQTDITFFNRDQLFLSDEHDITLEGEGT